MEETTLAMEHYDLAIIGRGMIGSAAARHAAKILKESNDDTIARIALIGPSEPSNRDDSRDIFAAHHDEGRITRRTDPDPIWAELASRSIARYDEIVKESGGKEFYVECGHLTVGLDDMIQKRKLTAASMGIECANLDAAALQKEFPYLAFPKGCVGIHERKKSGYISARGLVAAQTAAAQKLGVEIIDAVASRVERVEKMNGKGSFIIHVAGNQQKIKSNKVLVAAGAFCNTLLPKTLAITPIKTQTVHFVLSQDDKDRLRDMPSVIIKTKEMWAYILPPIRYPDGTIRLKLGGAYLDSRGNEFGPNREMHDHAEMIEWYQSNGTEEAKQDMEKMLRSIVPNVEPRTTRHSINKIISNSCVTLNTPTRQAYIGKIEDGWSVATGGNGYAAKSSDELGRLAAICVLDEKTFEQEKICGNLCNAIFHPRCL